MLTDQGGLSIIVFVVSNKEKQVHRERGVAQLG